MAAQYTQCTVRVMMHDQYFEQAVEFYELAKLFPSFRTEAVRILTELAGRPVGNKYTPEQDRWIAQAKPTTYSEGFRVNNPGYRDSVIESSFYWSDGTVDQVGDTNALISSHQTDFRGWSCNIGLESLFILYDGWVKKANCNQGGYMFHINDHYRHELPTTSELCTQNLCHCGTDVVISKAAMLPPDHPHVVQNLGGMRTFTNDEDFKRNHSKYIKITPQ
jgi:hypothetical protein